MALRVRVTEPVYLTLLFAGLLAGVSLGYVLGHKFPFTSTKDGWDIATAVGTVGAVVVALGFSLRTMWKERAERLGQAQLAAAFIQQPLELFKAQAKLLRTDLFRFFVPYGATPRNVELGPVFSNKLLDAGPEELKLYYQADPRVGVQVARAVVAVRSIKKWAEGTWVDPKLPAYMTPLLSYEAKWNADSAFTVYMSLEAACNIVAKIIDSVVVPLEHLDTEHPPKLDD